MSGPLPVFDCLEIEVEGFEECPWETFGSAPDGDFSAWMISWTILEESELVY